MCEIDSLLIPKPKLGKSPSKNKVDINILVLYIALNDIYIITHPQIYHFLKQIFILFLKSL